MPKTSAPRKPLPEHERTHESDRAIASAEDTAARAERSTMTVLIGCKLPNGLVMEIVAPGSGRTPAPAGKRVILKGANSLRTDRRAAQGVHPYAVTRVDRAFWEAWYERHKDREFVRRGLVFLAADNASHERAAENAAAAVAERAADPATRTGLEALAAKGDPRLRPGPTPMTTVEVDPSSVPDGRERQEPVAVA